MAATLRDVLLDICVKRGELTAEAVVEEASSVDSVLHPLFEWDDDEAARRYRLDQARGLIRRVKITRVIDNEPVRLRAFLPTRDKAGRTGVYAQTEDVLADPVAGMLVLNEFLRSWRQLKRRYQHLAAFREIVLHDLADGEAKAS